MAGGAHRQCALQAELADLLLQVVRVRPHHRPKDDAATTPLQGASIRALTALFHQLCCDTLSGVLQPGAPHLGRPDAPEARSPGPLLRMGLAAATPDLPTRLCLVRPLPVQACTFVSACSPSPCTCPEPV